MKNKDKKPQLTIKQRKEETLAQIMEIDKELPMIEKIHSGMINDRIRLQNRLELLNELEPEQQKEDSSSKK